jgi:hypothetical protein
MTNLLRLCNAAFKLEGFTYPNWNPQQYTYHKNIAVHKTFYPQGSHNSKWLPH